MCGLSFVLPRRSSRAGAGSGLGSVSWDVARPAGGRFDGAVVPDEPGGQPEVMQPVERRRAPDDGCGAGDVGVRARASRDADRTPARPGRLAGGRVDDVVHATSAYGPGADRRA